MEMDSWFNSDETTVKDKTKKELKQEHDREYYQSKKKNNPKILKRKWKVTDVNKKIKRLDGKDCADKANQQVRVNQAGCRAASKKVAVDAVTSGKQISPTGVALVKRH